MCLKRECEVKYNMIEIVSKKLCTGCSACMNVCPKHAIKMEVNREGFMVPVVDKNMCISCGLCKKVCPVLNTKKNDSINLCYVGYNNDKTERFTSSSGAVFSLIANYVLDNNGLVIGAMFDENNKLRHVAIEDKKMLDKLKGSKYLQSDLGDVFSYIKNNVNKRLILFVGTPCQVAGLKAYLKKDFANLICLDLFCHGVPSPKLFAKYVEELEKKYNNKLIDYNFRDKRSGWDSYSNTAIFNKKKVSQLSVDNKYMKLFLSDCALRESCYNCSFKLGNKYSDITLGDFWGVKRYYPELYNNEGVSAIIINTLNGKAIFDKIKKDMTYKKCKLDEIVNSNPALKKSCNKNNNREKFFEDIDNLIIKDLIEKYVPKQKFKIRFINKLKFIIKYILKKIKLM